MKNLVVLFVSILLMTITVEGVKAQNAVFATAQAGATIIAPMTITKNVDLNFGNIASGSAAGSVVLSTSGDRTALNVTLPSVPGTVSAAAFTVAGLVGANYKINLPTSITISNGTTTMTIDEFEENANKVLAAGTETFNVGATINLAANQAAGSYTGSFAVTVDYE
jgi:hypothetical protein